MKRFLGVLFALVLGFSLAIGLSSPVQAAATFTVNSTSDDVDWNPGDGVAETAPGNGVCTLRAAIQETNALAGPDTITFNIPSAGPHTIQPLSALPTITDPVIIDGYTQPGASPNTNPPGLGTNAVLMIELDGSRAGAGADGLLIFSGNSAVRGLVINRFDDGIELRYDGGNVIEGNFIGTDITGTTALGNSWHGVRILFALGNTIGGTTAEARNVISGNAFMGVDIFGGSEAAGNLVQGNFIGTDVTGIVDLGNGWDGVFINDVANNTIGGITAEAGNVISGNDHSGVRIIGSSATGNLVQGNSVFSNVRLGIDLGGDGVTPNDPGDGDTGANSLQNFPVLTSANSGSTTIEGMLNSTPNTEFRLEFFSNTECNASGYGEGETFLGSIDVTTDGSGNVSFAVTFPDTVPGGHFITATATDPNNNTSEFSQGVQVTAVLEATIDIDPDTLNLNSKGKWITAYIELPAGYDVGEIDISTVTLNGIVPALAHPTEVGDYDGDGVPDLMVKFDRSDVQDVLEPGDEVEVTVSGELIDGTPFEGTATIRVIEQGKN